MRELNPELFIITSSLALLSLNLVCCNIIFSLELYPEEKERVDEDKDRI